MSASLFQKIPVLRHFTRRRNGDPTLIEGKTERNERGERGAAAVEFALGATILVTLAFGSAEYGFTLQKTHSIGSTVRQAARVAATPCIPDADCKVGNRAYDDYYVLRSIEAGLGDYWKEVDKVVIYKIVGYSTTAGDGAVPKVCLNGSVSTISPQVYCNTYTSATIFNDLSTNTNKNLFKNLDSFEDQATGKDNLPQLKSVFGAGLNCLKPDNTAGLSAPFCPTTPKMRTRSLRSPSRTGIYVQVKHPFVTGMFGQERNLQQWSVFSLEPHPDDNTTDLVNSTSGPGPTGPSQFDLAISKTGPTLVQPGDPMEYTIEVSNVGHDQVRDATVSDQIPTGLENVTWTCTATSGSTCPAAGGGSNLGLITLKPNHVATYKLNGTLSLSFRANGIENVATVVVPSVDGTTDGNLSNNTDNHVTNVIVPDVSVTKTNGLGELLPGTNVEYTINVVNLAGKAKQVTVIDSAMATSYTNVSWTCTGNGGATCPNASGTGGINETVPVLNQSPASLTYKIKGDLPFTASGTVSNTVNVDAQVDLQSGNNTATDADLVAQPDLRTTVSLVTVAQAGATATYKVRYENVGGVSVNAAPVTHTIPTAFGSSPVTWSCVAVGAGASCPAATGTGNLSATLNLPKPVLPSASYVEYTFSGKLPQTASGTFSVTGSVGLPGGLIDKTPADNSNTQSTTVTAVNLKVTKSVSVGSGANVSRDQAISYTVKVQNNSANSAEITNAKLTDLLPSNFTASTVTCASSPAALCPAIPATWGASNPLTIALLPATSSVTFTINGKVSLAAPAGSSVVATAATVRLPAPATFDGEFETVTTDNVSSAPTNPIVYPTFSVTGSVLDAVMYGGQTGNKYTIVVTNNGPGPVVNGPFAFDLTPVPISITGQTCTASATGTCSAFPALGTKNITTNLSLASGETATIVLTFNANSGAAVGTYTRTASATIPGGATATKAFTFDIQNPDIWTDKWIDAATPATVGPGSTVVYKIVAHNDGPGTVTGATVTDTVPNTLTSVTWQCVATAPNSCGTTGVQSGNNVSTLVTLAETGTATITVTGTVTASATSIVNTANITPPSGVTDRGLQANLNPPTITVVKPDIAVSKTSPYGNVGRGQTVSYSITVTNTSGVVSGIPFTDTVPGAVVVSNWSCSGSGSATCSPVSGTTNNISSSLKIGGGETVTFTVNGTISTSATLAPMGNFTNTASVSPATSVGDTNSANNSSSKTLTIVGPDVAVLIDDAKTNIGNGQANTYTVQATNNGPVSANGSAVSFTLPSGYTSISWTCAATGGATCPSASGTGTAGSAVSQTIAAFPVSGKVTYTVNGTVSSSATGTLTATASVTAPAGLTDPVTGNNTASDTTAITAPSFSITGFSDGLTTLGFGQVPTYTLNLKNTGSISVSGANVSMVFPSQFGTSIPWTCTAGGGATCPVASGTATSLSFATAALTNVPANGTLTYSFTPTVLGSATVGSNAAVSATVNLTGNAAPTAEKNQTDTDVIAAPVLAISKTANVSVAKPGDLITYTITVTNSGPGNVTSGTVSDPVPTNLTGVTWTCSGMSGATCPASGSGAISSAAVSINDGKSVTFTYKGTIVTTATGTVQNTASATGPKGTVSATATTSIYGPDISVTKNDGVTSVDVGTLNEYTIVVKNNSTTVSGPGVNLIDNVPATLTGVTWTCTGSGGASCQAASGTGNINATGTLPAGGIWTYKLKGTVAITASGTISNTATVSASSAGADPTTGNNNATDIDTVVTPDLSITKYAAGTDVITGTEVTYTLDITNNSSTTLTGVTVADTMPAVFTPATVSWTCVSNCAGSGSGNLSKTLTMTAGQVVRITIKGTVAATAPAGSLANTATVTAPSGVTDRNPGNNSATDTKNLKKPAAGIGGGGDGT